MNRHNLGHGTADAGTPGMQMSQGRGHDVLHHVFFGGRRRRVFTRLAALSRVRLGNWVLDVGCGTGDFTHLRPKWSRPAVPPWGGTIGSWRNSS